ncbi:MAG: hypothetical protein NVSMB70_11890 [Chamaesiphon sp.]
MIQSLSIKKMNIIYSSSLLRRIWRETEKQAVNIDFWIAHALTNDHHFYIYAESLQLLGKPSYHNSQPSLVKNKDNKLDSGKLRQKAIKKIDWAAQKKNNQGYMTVMKLNQCLLSNIDWKILDTILEETKEAVILLDDEFEGYFD